MSEEKKNSSSSKDSSDSSSDEERAKKSYEDDPEGGDDDRGNNKGGEEGVGKSGRGGGRGGNARRVSVNPFFNFMAEVRSQMAGQTAARAAALWRLMSAHEKQPYVQMARRERLRRRGAAS